MVSRCSFLLIFMCSGVLLGACSGSTGKAGATGDGGKGTGVNSALKKQFCGRLVTAAAACPSPPDSAICLGRLKSFSDDQVDEAGDCLNEKTCVGLKSCFDEAFPEGGGTVVTPPISTPVTPPRGGGKAMCGGATATDACGECNYTSCCTELAACVSDAGCVALEQCVTACTTADCVQTCINKSSASALGLINDYLTCSDTNCKVACK
jgi:hypothetical protein